MSQNWLMLLCVLIVELSALREGAPPLRLPPLEQLSEWVLRLELGELTPAAEPVESLRPTPSPSPPPSPAPSPVPTDPALPVSLPVVSETPTPVPDFSGELITCRTESEPDIAAILAMALTQKISREGPQILIYHTHGTEAYTPSEGWEYTATEEYRTTESSRNMIRVGEELRQVLEARGYQVLHDTALCDYPSYNGAYSRSELILRRTLEEYPSVTVALDVHRDAIGEGGTMVTTRWEGGDAAQIMLLTGTGEIGLSHPRWQENFRLALEMQGMMNGVYPGLARPVELVGERYNQQYTTGALLLEVGSTGNTLPEAITAVRAFGECMADVLDGLERQ